jgi:hypothetical protein
VSGETLWYVQHGQSAPIGPIETRVVSEGISSGRLPVAAVICPVGGTAWTALSTHPQFARAVRQRAMAQIPALPGARDDLDFGDDVKTQVVQSPLDIFAGRNFGPAPPPPLVPPAPTSSSALPPVMVWATPPANPSYPGSNRAAVPLPQEPRPHPHPAIFLGIALGVSLLLAGIIILVMRAR